jgi:hypothetical protein
MLYFSVILCIRQYFSIVSVYTIRGTVVFVWGAGVWGIVCIPVACPCVSTKQNQYKSTRRKPTGKTHTLAHINKTLAKGAWQQKRRKEKTYIYIYTFRTDLILILIPILPSPQNQKL